VPLPAEDPLALVLMTAPDAAVAARLGEALVAESLAACATIVPSVTSIYRWQGAVHTDAEAQVLLKTQHARVPALLRRAAELHPYDVPELLALPVEASAAYGAWVREMTAPPAGEPEA
jgi:periplasmic divalent cation tolerance protein